MSYIYQVFDSREKYKPIKRKKNFTWQDKPIENIYTETKEIEKWLPSIAAFLVLLTPICLSCVSRAGSGSSVRDVCSRCRRWRWGGRNKCLLLICNSKWHKFFRRSISCRVTSLIWCDFSLAPRTAPALPTASPIFHRCPGNGSSSRIRIITISPTCLRFLSCNIYLHIETVWRRLSKSQPQQGYQQIWWDYCCFFHEEDATVLKYGWCHHHFDMREDDCWSPIRFRRE